MLWLFSKGFWRTFGARLFKTLFREGRFRYDFGYGRADVKDVCKYYLEPETARVLKDLVVDEELKGVNERDTMRRIMRFVKNNYNPTIYYTRDGRDRWNHPLETLQSFAEAKNGERRSFSTDCDDYAILIYSLSRIAGVRAENLYLCFMKTRTEWHMNVMFFWRGVPYAVEGTYYPSIAISNLGVTPYFSNSVKVGGVKTYYYEGVRWVWNENELRRNNNKLNGV